MAPIVFRPANPADEQDLLRMMRTLAEQGPGAYFFDEPAVRKALRTFLTDSTFGKTWMFTDGATSVGYIVLTLSFSFEYHGLDAFIDELYVEPQFRRQGIGRRAVQFVEERARDLGVQALHLEVDPGNDPALELYRRTGYEDHQRRLMTKLLALPSGSPR